jgi:hypothetical protein
VRNVDLSILLDLVVDVDGYEVGGFGESINDHQNRIKLVGSQRQTQNEVHTNIISLPIWNPQRLQQTFMLHIVSIDLTAGITF